MTDEDPHPSAQVTGDDGSTQYSLFGWMLPYRDAVAAGDRAKVDHLLITHYGDKCWTEDPQWRAEMAKLARDGSQDTEQSMEQKYAAYLSADHS